MWSKRVKFYKSCENRWTPGPPFWHLPQIQFNGVSVSSFLHFKCLCCKYFKGTSTKFVLLLMINVFHCFCPICKLNLAELDNGESLPRPKYWILVFFSVFFIPVEFWEKIFLTPMGVLAPRSADARPSIQPPIDVRNFFLCMCLQSRLQTSIPIPHKACKKFQKSMKIFEFLSHPLCHSKVGNFWNFFWSTFSPNQTILSTFH